MGNEIHCRIIDGTVVWRCIVDDGRIIQTRRRHIAMKQKITVGVAALVLSLLSATAEADPKVEEQVVGPANNEATYFVSQHGQHLATVTRKGSRCIVVVDGVEGPPFDDILWTSSPANNNSLRLISGA